ncbi:uncharacterized protein A4U43_C10F15100 [Asparagus officinalis]|uniref:Uncharacterized protein n=1 Tax=Asparagus officinalis TaxID=4686 RepID=A0A5P1E3A5_ASPOF|nr:uncharacterized protein A4U43_C10F15100 [Asparagus officinalis]
MGKSGMKKIAVADAMASSHSAEQNKSFVGSDEIEEAREDWVIVRRGDGFVGAGEKMERRGEQGSEEFKWKRCGCG